ncbi:uncharacterized protein BO88DRAFT_403267 [Aspergillus vadensis CBS 113365]|uniref:Uncharacterized protein n=1 Tax=Aspergillus vadensis (strain CBS 113365 / IMI 142717 / IBT 24658) TaxID=1448311 RepID=A0A319BD77_ASPVC|nr:hypothetical protein BO88DRAFT_403267 [Aspergillus vadensis CBS 113365]PYH71096.1 hypothetical protein BO88DRAFT_403267 [Aspergillus vadensis CBS 113365]
MQSMHNASPSLALVSVQLPSVSVSQSSHLGKTFRLGKNKQQIREGGAVLTVQPDMPHLLCEVGIDNLNPSPIPVVPVCGDVMNA